jgi:hypothetical protein
VIPIVAPGFDQLTRSLDQLKIDVHSTSLRVQSSIREAGQPAHQNPECLVSTDPERAAPARRVPNMPITDPSGSG